jgi:CheY-like chemotaxis protein
MVLEGLRVTFPQAKPRILVVDDTPANRMAFEAILERSYDVTLAASGEQAVELCRTREFSVIVLDVRMPGMDGFETARAIRGRQDGAMPPIIIFTTAYEQNLSQITRGFSAGATDFLFSPVEADLLLLKVATYARITQQFESLRFEVRTLTRALTDAREQLARNGGPGAPGHA